MTHRFPLSLLEDYVDNELSEEEAEQFRRWLQLSPELQQEYIEAARLKELLGRLPVHNPGKEYWSEVTDLILARTSGMPASEDEPELERQRRVDQRRAFYRSLISAAAALLIFFTALMLGSGRIGEKPVADAGSGPILVTAALAERLDMTGDSYMTKSERTYATVGMMLLGSPGHLGRFSALPEIFGIE